MDNIVFSDNGKRALVSRGIVDNKKNIISDNGIIYFVKFCPARDLFSELIGPKITNIMGLESAKNILATSATTNKEFLMSQSIYEAGSNYYNFHELAS